METHKHYMHFMSPPGVRSHRPMNHAYWTCKIQEVLTLEALCLRLNGSWRFHLNKPCSFQILSMLGMHHSVVHHVIYEVYHLLQAQFFQQYFVVQNSQDHSLAEVSGTQYTRKKFLIVTEVFATVLVYKAQRNKANIMHYTAVKSVQLSSYNILIAKE